MMSVTAYISAAEPPQREMLTILRTWILDLGHHCQEKMANSRPTFHFFGPLCYLRITQDKVLLGFFGGKFLDDEAGIFEPATTAATRTIEFSSVAMVEEYEESVRRLLNEAAVHNESHSRNK